MTNKSDVTIVIPTMANERNEYALRECLTSLKESDFPMENVIIAVNGSFTFHGSYISSKLVWIEEQGQCKAVNAAVATVKTPWVMISNDDMVYPPNWFENLTDPIGKWWIDGKPVDVAELKPHSFLHTDAVDGAHSVINEPFTISPILIEPRKGAPTFVELFCGGIGGDWDKQKFLDYCAGPYLGAGLRSGFNLPFLLKKETWDMVGGYDVAYDPWGSNSDSDLEYKLKLAGVKMCQNTNCPVYHFSNTSDTFVPVNRPYWEKNWQYFIEKWGFERTDSGIWEATFEIPMDKLKYHPIWENIYATKS